VGALNRQAIGTRIDEQERRLRVLLVGSQARAKAHIRAMAALGALQRTVVSSIPEQDLRAERDAMVDAAMAVLTCHRGRASAVG
jgi:hypothetical protein